MSNSHPPATDSARFYALCKSEHLTQSVRARDALRATAVSLLRFLRNKAPAALHELQMTLLTLESAVETVPDLRRFYPASLFTLRTTPLSTEAAYELCTRFEQVIAETYGLRRVVVN